jgi:CRP-like cAMP-binding protein
VEHPAQRQLAEAARTNHLLAALPEREISRILGSASLVELEQRRLLYREDGRISGVYFPVDAVISILVGSEETFAMEIATVGNEGVVGAGALLGVPRTFGRTVVQVAGRAIAVREKDVAGLLCEQPNVSTLVRRYLYAFIRQVGQAAPCNRLHSAEERCARWLLMMQDRARTDEFSITQEFLASMMGSRRATVNLAISMLEKAGAIDYRYRTLTVVDRQQLESFACPCYRIIRKAFEMVRLDSTVADNSR